MSQRYYVTTGGAGDNNFLSFLKGHPEVKSVLLCQDNDAAGNKFAKDLGDKLRGMGYQVSRCLPKGKDFNEDLLNEIKQDKQDYTPDIADSTPDLHDSASDSGTPHSRNTYPEVTKKELGFYKAMAMESDIQNNELLDDNFDQLEL